MLIYRKEFREIDDNINNPYPCFTWGIGYMKR